MEWLLLVGISAILIGLYFRPTSRVDDIEAAEIQAYKEDMLRETQKYINQYVEAQKH